MEKSLQDVLGIPNRRTLEHFETDLLPNLFGRQTTRGNLRDLLSLGSCSIDSFRIALDWIQRCAFLYANDFKLYNTECFKIKDGEDGIKALMIRGLDENRRSSYLMQLGMRLQTELIEVFSPGNYFYRYSSATLAIKETIQTLSTAVRIKEEYALIDGILLNLYNVVSDNNCSEDKKSDVLRILNQLAEDGCLNPNNQIIIELVYQVQDLISSKDRRILRDLLRLIANLAKSGLLQGIEPKLIEAILVNAPDLLNHLWLKDVVQVAINALCELAEAGLFKNVQPKAIEDFLSMAIGFLYFQKQRSHYYKVQERSSKVALMICKFIELARLETIELMVIKNVLLNVKNKATQEESIQKIFDSIFKQTELGLLEAKPDVIEDILIQASKLQNKKRGRSIMGLVSCILLSNKTGLINQISPNVIEIWSADLKKILDGNEEGMYVNSYFDWSGMVCSS